MHVWRYTTWLHFLGDQGTGPLNLDGSPFPHDYSTVTAPSHGKPGGQAQQGVREEKLQDLPASGSQAVVSPASVADKGDAESADSAIDPAPVQGSSSQGSPLEATLESAGQLGPSSQVPESSSVHESSSIPSLGPDLLGPEPETDSKTASASAEERNDRSTTLHEGSSFDSDIGTVPSDPTSADESTTGHDDDSAFNREKLPSNTRDTISENSLDSESRKTESSEALKTSSGNSLEQIPQPNNNNTDVNPSRLEPDGGREGGGREGVNTPLTTADSSGMGREEVKSQTIDGIDRKQLSGAAPAAGPGDGDAVAESGGNADPTRCDHIPANTGSAGINAAADLVSLDHQPLNASLSLENADSESLSSLIGASLENGSLSLESGSKHGAAPGSGDQSADLGSKNGSQTVDNLGGPNGTGVGVGASHGGSVQNQTEAASSKNRNQTGNGGPGLGNGLPAQQKEKSVFLRLSNHIDALEANMTLFSIFLDQISTR